MSIAQYSAAFTVFFIFISFSVCADQATLHVQKSDKVGTIRPTWHVSFRVRADISEANIDEGTEPTARIRDWIQNDVGCPAGDDAGHYIANSLGGSGSNYQNIFPENTTLNRGKQSQWEKVVKEYVQNECSIARVTVTVSFRDTEDPDTRPVSVRYRTRCVGNVTPGGRKSLPTKTWNNIKPKNCP